MTLSPVHHPPRRPSPTAVDEGAAPAGFPPPAGAPTPCSVRYHADSGVIVVDAYRCTWVNDTRGDGLWWVSPLDQPDTRDLVRSVDTLCWLNAEAATVVRALCTGRHLQAVR